MAKTQLTETEQQGPVSVEDLNHGRRVFDFLKIGAPAFIISMILVVASIIIVWQKGFNLGLDFTGGTSVEITLSQPVELEQIRSTMSNAGYHDPIVQYYGSSRDIIIRLPPVVAKDANDASQVMRESNQLGTELSNLMHRDIDPDAVVKRVEFVGPSVGAELAQDGVLAIIAALVCILIYIWFRFEWRFGTGAVIGLAHDVVITVGYLSLFQRELDLTIIAALLSIIGYSLNDTIVVFDRIRENFTKIRRASPYDVINISLTQTLSRTLMTSGTTLAVVICLYIWGGSMLKGFSETLGIGIILGTVSSIYVAAYTALKLGSRRENFMPPKVEAEGADQDPIMR
ncbi:protein translocase subunit SecF [Zophobihabitans entericus]|uniref:Protein-export membrane protein SecF n=1 Tax=Zophobihabitans entericus TaxID=1635327 RepID=A0A6G9I830_9GAMM|nr:protein translocase subunit SecF [Zophobihabitans entericus]QIQ20365.1 protein translocase subunit SecF [Zophobihabitans entericus]